MFLANITVQLASVSKEVVYTTYMVYSIPIFLLQKNKQKNKHGICICNSLKWNSQQTDSFDFPKVGVSWSSETLFPITAEVNERERERGESWGLWQELRSEEKRSAESCVTWNE